MRHRFGLFVQGHEPDLEGRINSQVVSLKSVEGVELIFGEMQGSKAGSSSSFGQRQAQLHNQNARKQVAVKGGGFVADYVAQHDVDPLVKEAAGEIAGILDADALLPLSLGSFPGCGVAGYH